MVLDENCPPYRDFGLPSLRSVKPSEVFVLLSKLSGDISCAQLLNGVHVGPYWLFLLFTAAACKGVTC